MGLLEYVIGAITALVVVGIGIIFLSAIGSVIGIDPILSIILLLILGIGIIAAVVFVIIRS